MPVRVNVPIKLTIAPGDFRDQLDDVVRAVGTSVERALKRSCEAVIEARGGYEGVTCMAPTFDWRPSTGHVAGPMREMFERRVAATIAHAMERSGVYAYREQRAKAPEVLPEGAGEILDVERYDEELDLYWIPTYDKKGEKKPAVVKGKKAGEKKDTPPPPRRQVVAADFFEFDSEDSQDFYNTFGWKVSLHFEGRQLPDVFGVLYRIKGVANTMVSIWERGAKKWRIYRFQLTVLQALERQTLVLDKLGSYAWERRSDTAEALKQFRESEIKQIFSQLLKNRKIKPEDKEAVEKQAKATAEARVAEHTLNWELTHPAFYWFVHPDGKLNVAFSAERAAQMPAVGYVEIVPLAEPIIVAEGNAEAAAKGTGGGQAKYNLGKGEIPGEGGDGSGGTPGGIGHTLAMKYDVRWGSKFAFRTTFDPATQVTRSMTAFEVVCEPYWGEPSVFTYPGGMELWAQIQKVADALEIEPCQYAAKFAINAAKVLGGRAEGIETAVTLDTEDFLADFLMGEVNEKGEFAWKTVPSPAIQQLRLLGSFVPMLQDLYELVKKHLFPISDLTPRGYFLQDFDGAMEAAIVWIYLYACQISLLQLLTASRKNIEDRVDPKNLSNYALMAKVMLTSIGTDQIELIRLRDALEHFQKRGRRLSVHPEQQDYELKVFFEYEDLLPIYREYAEADFDSTSRRGLGSSEEQQARSDRFFKAYDELEKLRDRDDLWFRYVDLDKFVRSRAQDKEHLGHITPNPQNPLVNEICDSYGTRWSMTELNKTIAIRQQYIESTEPIIQHIKFTEDVPALVNNPASIEGKLKEVLNRMLSKNKEVRRDALDDPKWAFEHSKIEKPKGKNDYYANQSGLHAMAHGVLEDAFRGNGFWRYPWALEHLYSHQVGWVSLRDTFLFVGIVAISILCPPLGSVLGVIEAAWRYGEAKDTEALYEAQWDPAGSGIISRAEVEAQMFVAKLGLALAIIPAVGEITGPVARGVKVAVSQGLKAGARELAESLLRKLAKELAKKLGPALILQIAALPVLNEVMSTMIDPFVEDAIRQVDVAMPRDVPLLETLSEKLPVPRGPAAGEDPEFYDPADDDYIDVPEGE